MTINATTRSLRVKSYPNDKGRLFKYPNGEKSTTWVFEGLETGTTGLTWDDTSGGVNTYAWDSANSCVRITYNTAATSGLEWSFPDALRDQVYIKYDIRRNNTKCSKQIKIFSQGISSSPQKYSNATIGPSGGGYTGTSYSIQYGDNPSSNNDNAIGYKMNGTTIGGTVFRKGLQTPYIIHKSTADVTQNVAGTVWETYEIFAKFGDPGARNGEFAVRKNGEVVFHAKDVWNTADDDPANHQKRKKVTIGAYSASTDFYEEYKNLKISYERPLWLPLAPTTIFADSFESGNLSRTLNGASWGGSEGTSYVSVANVYISSNTTGNTSALTCQYTGNANLSVGTSAGRNFDLGALYDNLFVEFDLYIPNGTEPWGGATYKHRNGTISASDNNKFIRLWQRSRSDPNGDGYNSDEKYGASTVLASSANTSNSDIITECVNAGDAAVGPSAYQGRAYNFINASDYGKWMRVKMFFKTRTTTSNGSMMLWKNDTLLIDQRNLIDSVYDPTEPRGFRYGYLLGYANSGFDETTKMLIDNVHFYTAAQPEILGTPLKIIVPDGAANNTIADFNTNPGNRSTYSNTRGYLGSTSIKSRLVQGQPAIICGGAHQFAWRDNFPVEIPEGHTIWYRARLYIPSTLPLGYNYTGNGDSLKFSGSYLAGATNITLLDNSGTAYTNYNIGDSILVRLDNNNLHYTTVSSKSTNVVTLTNALPSAASNTANNNIYFRDLAEATYCGNVGGSTLYTDGSGTLKFFCLMPGDGSVGYGVNYLNLQVDRRGFGNNLGLYVISENQNDTGGADYNDAIVPRDQWFTLQMAVKVGSADNSGFIRTWLNGNFVGELITATSNPSKTSIGRWGIGDYWNGIPWTNGTTATDSFWIDDIILASDYGPYGGILKQDSGGRLYIPDSLTVRDICGYGE